MFKVLKSMIAGIFTGAVLGVLFAPKKGSETRKKLKAEGLDGVKDTAKDMGSDIQSTYNNILKDENVKSGIKKAKFYGNKASTKAKELYKENIPTKDRKKIEKTLSNTKKTIEKGIQKAADVVDDLSKSKKKK